MNHRFKSKRKLFFIVPILILFGLSAIVMWLWNAILPNVVNVSSITYWQAMGILVLSKILFGGFGCGKHKHSMQKKHWLHKMKQMTPEEREKFKQEWKQRFQERGFCKKED
ncbi:MAG: hypothetical protein R2802_12655 [Flavobacteriaceae bacterium]|nr:hypothetical protein [Mangrovimonas sp.]MCB0471249.1 hypothetical protein [Flavobacteriaceae bacterium]MCB0433143.1 hypothetical protein [Mangrovimonas sp.]MCB0439106.1 hypothetical protein [Mangrovimonas sp.]HPF96257.1 hypothetical protein [Mangrovimonas sp.]